MTSPRVLHVFPATEMQRVSAFSFKKKAVSGYRAVLPSGAISIIRSWQDWLAYGRKTNTRIVRHGSEQHARGAQ